MKNCICFLLLSLFFGHGDGYGQPYAPVIKEGARFTYSFYLHGQTIPFELSIKSLADTLDLHWNIRGLAGGDYIVLPVAWDHADKMNFIQPVPGTAIRLAGDETFCMISKTAYARLVKTRSFVYNNTVYLLKDDINEHPLLLEGRPLDLLHVVAEDETTEFWILNNPAFPLVCKINGNVLGIDCSLNAISR